MTVDVLVIDDGSRDDTRAIARDAGVEVISNPSPLGSAPRCAWASPRRATAATTRRSTSTATASTTRPSFERVLEPVARGRADYVVGSRFLGDRDGMAWHRTLANRLASALLGTLMGTVVSDGQSGYRAFSPRALAAARIRHDYNYAQVLTLSLWGARIDPVEVPISYSRRRFGGSFVRYPEYFARVAPALWREFRQARKQRATSAAPIAPATDVRLRIAVVEQRQNVGRAGPTGASGPTGRQPAAAPAHVDVEPHGRGEADEPPAGARPR